jgi:hypothetical protein
MKTGILFVLLLLATACGRSEYPYTSCGYGEPTAYLCTTYNSADGSIPPKSYNCPTQLGVPANQINLSLCSHLDLPTQ